MTPKHRAPIERIFEIIKMLKTGKKMNASTLATHFEVDRKTIQRDITFVRDRLKMPISYNPHTNSIETL